MATIAKLDKEVVCLIHTPLLTLFWSLNQKKRKNRWAAKKREKRIDGLAQEQGGWQFVEHTVMRPYAEGHDVQPIKLMRPFMLLDS